MPWQLSGNGRNGWSTKLIRGLKAEAAAGFQSRRERCREPTPVTPQYAAFPTYKAARVHHTTRQHYHVAARCACAKRSANGADRLSDSAPTWTRRRCVDRRVTACWARPPTGPREQAHSDLTGPAIRFGVFSRRPGRAMAGKIFINYRRDDSSGSF